MTHIELRNPCGGIAKALGHLRNVFYLGCNLCFYFSFFFFFLPEVLFSKDHPKLKVEHSNSAHNSADKSWRRFTLFVGNQTYHSSRQIPGYLLALLRTSSRTDSPRMEDSDDLESPDSAPWTPSIVQIRGSWAFPQIKRISIFNFFPNIANSCIIFNSLLLLTLLQLFPPHHYFPLNSFTITYVPISSPCWITKVEFHTKKLETSGEKNSSAKKALGRSSGTYVHGEFPHLRRHPCLGQRSGKRREKQRLRRKEKVTRTMSQA